MIVDDHRLVGEGLCAALAAQGRFDVIAVTGSAAEARSAAANRSLDLALVDLHLPDLAGVELCRELRVRHRRLEVAILSSSVAEEPVREAIAAGASAFISKSSGLGELTAALERMVGGEPESERQIDALLRGLLSRRGRRGEITPQQQRVLELSAQGLTYREAGERMFISESTVRFHIGKLKAALGARTKTELVATAIRTGLIPAVAEEPS